MSKKRRDHITRRTRPLIAAPKRFLLALPYIIVVGAAVAIGYPIGLKFGAGSVKPLPVAPPPTIKFTPDTVADPYPDLGHLLSMTPNQLEAVDIAVLDLDCTKGLPGAEGVDVMAECQQLDVWAEHVRSETERNFHQFTDHPEQFENSESYFRILSMITVLQQDMGVHYNMSRLMDGDYSHVNDVMISGLLGPDRDGTCASMPVLYVAIGRRLGYPLKLVSARGHLFARWDSPDGKVRFNIEATGRGLTCPADSFFTMWPYKLSDDEIKTGMFLRSMIGVEEIATFLIIRGNVLESLGRLPEAELAYTEAHTLLPPHDGYLSEVAVGVDKERLLRAGQLDPSLPNNRFRDAKEKDYAQLPPDSVGGATVVHDEGSGK